MVEFFDIRNLFEPRFELLPPTSLGSSKQRIGLPALDGPFGGATFRYEPLWAHNCQRWRATGTICCISHTRCMSGRVSRYLRLCGSCKRPCELGLLAIALFQMLIVSRYFRSRKALALAGCWGVFSAFGMTARQSHSITPCADLCSSGLSTVRLCTKNPY